MSSHPIITAGEPILRCQNILGEGPLWDSDLGVVNWVDIEKGEIHTFNPSTKAHSVQSYGPKRIGSIALRANHPGSFVAGVERSICFTSPSSPGELIPVASPIPEGVQYGEVDRFNDGVVDRKGRFVTGTMSQTKGGAQLYSVNPDLTSSILLEPISCSNGTGWSPDDKTLYFVDSAAGSSINAFDYDLETGGISNRREFAKDTFMDGGTFDGLTMDQAGCVWVARWKSSRVVKYNSDGSIGLEVRFPKAANITCCIFGGKDLDELYVTTASCEASGEEDLVGKFPEGGDLYMIKIEGTKGVEKFKFGG